MAQLKPSEVVDRKFIRMPEEDKVVESDEEWERCGKWVLSSPDTDFAFADKAWTDLQPLLADGTLLMLKSSTAKMKSEDLMIFCFTRPGKDEAKRAAAAIRKVVDYRGLMYYKVNNYTKAGIDRRFGFKQVSVYMCTFLGRFYKRDFLDRWILDDEDRDEIEFSPPSKLYRNNYLGSDELPSKSPEHCLNLQHTGRLIRGPYWFFRCDYSEVDDMHLTEADYVWIVFKKFFDEDVFSRISCLKYEASAEMRFYVSEDADVTSQLEFCDIIFRETSFRSTIYFSKIKKGPTNYDYKYTAEGELYKFEEFVEIFVLQRGSVFGP